MEDSDKGFSRKRCTVVNSQSTLSMIRGEMIFEILSLKRQSTVGKYGSCCIREVIDAACLVLLSSFWNILFIQAPSQMPQVSRALPLTVCSL